MSELKISKVKGGYTSSARLVFQSWLKDIHVHVQDSRLTQERDHTIGEGFHYQTCLT